MTLRTLALLAALVLAAPGALAAAIERVEPPFWWTGFKDTGLQLMVHGEGIGAAEPGVDHPGVTLRRVERGDSPNYLFVYLDIAPDTATGPFEIAFELDGERHVHRYELRAKNPDPGWARGFDSSDAIYLITPDRFVNGDTSNDNVEGMGDAVDRSNPGGRHGGDIQGILNALDYIDDMGFTAIWLNPVLENRMPEYSYHGYSTTDFYRVDPRYGSNAQYRELVQTARARGIGTIMDMIVNHVGSEHPWMDDLPTEDWINHPDDPYITSHDRVVWQDPNASVYDRAAFSEGWFVFTMPDLNQRNRLLADYLTQNALWWIEYLGLAGIRMDTWPYPNKHYMSEWTRRVMAEYPQFNVVGEEWTTNIPTVAYWQRGQFNHDGYVSYLPSLMDFPVQEAMRDALREEEHAYTNEAPFNAGWITLYHTVANDFVYPSPSSLVVFPDNHDMDRIFTQLREDHDTWRMAMAYVLTLRGTPQVYYGTEILATNADPGHHGQIRSDFPGGWPGDAVNAFTGAGLGEKQREAQAFVRTLLRWRRDKPVLHDGRLMHFRPFDGIYAQFRYDDEDAVMLVMNKNAEAVDVALERFRERLDGHAQFVDVLSGERMPIGDVLRVPARGLRLLDLD